MMEDATFAAGCFWGVEAAFLQVAGVIDTEVGYMGGTVENPSYKDVCSGYTGHAEVVHVKFDPAVISYEELLEIFWTIHDPTQLNRQGPDIGAQYRSSVFYYNDGQRDVAEKQREQYNADNRFGGMIMTEIVPASPFWRAEEYHQRYHEKNGGACHI